MESPELVVPAGPGVLFLDADALDRLAEAIARRLAERDPPGLIDRPTLAARLLVSERTVTALAGRGQLPPGVLIGGVRRWDWDEVRKFLSTRVGRKARRGRGIYARERQVAPESAPKKEFDHEQ